MATPQTWLSWESVLAWRVARQHLARRSRKDATTVASDICGLHAQLMRSAQLSLWARIDGLQPRVVDRALWQDRTLAKTWLMRGTLHLLPASDLPVWTAALGTLKPRYERASWQRAFGLSQAQMEAILPAIADALADQMLSREQLATAVAERTGDPGTGQALSDSWGAVLKLAAFRGDLCYAPDAGSRVRFTRPDTWLKDWSPADPDTAMREVTTRYLSAYGPATRELFARWFGCSPADAGKRIKALGDEVTEVAVAGEPMWTLTADVDHLLAVEPGGVVRLLPAFDPYVIASPRAEPAVLAPERKALVHRQQGWISPVLLVDGRIAGTWSDDLTKDRLAVEVQAFEKIPTAVAEAAEGEARLLAEQLGASDAELRWADV